MNADAEFRQMEEWYKTSRKRSKTTAREGVLRFMLDNLDLRTWWWSWEFVGKTTEAGDYLSHRAPARASDLAIFEPLLVETRKIGQFSVYRLRMENIHLINIRLNTHKEIKGTEHPTKLAFEPVYENGKQVAVRPVRIPLL